jgi:hypothetical protein
MRRRFSRQGNIVKPRRLRDPRAMMSGRWRTAIVVCVCAASGAAAIASCGPSIRRTYQSDNAFTRCFDLDYRPGVAALEKAGCWRHWLDDHVYNQPDDKIEYAALRLEELANGISVPGPPGPPGAFHVRPNPTSEEVAPVADAPGADGGVDGGSAAVATGLACEEPCRSSLAACRGSCGGAAACVTACEDGYRACMRSCFQ